MGAVIVVVVMVVVIVMMVAVICMGVIGVAALPVVVAVVTVVAPLVLVHADAVIVVAVLMVLLSHHLVALEQAHAQQQRQGHLPFHRPQDAGLGLDRQQLRFHRRQPLLIDQIALVEQDHVAVDHLGARHLALQDRGAEVLGIHQGDDRIEAGEIAQVAAQEGHRHRQRIGQAGGLDHQVVDLLGSLQNAINGLQQLAVDRAADAAVAELHRVVPRGDDQVVVDADFAEFIHQHRRFQALLVGEDVVEQGGLARSEEAGEDRHRQADRLGVHLGIDACGGLDAGGIAARGSGGRGWGAGAGHRERRALRPQGRQGRRPARR